MRALIPLVLVACAPIPVSKTFVMWPARIVRVVDRETGQPISGANVRLVRNRHPHTTQDEVKTLKTSERGEVAVARETRSLRVFPLMMHGVPGFSFTACAEAPGHAAITLTMGQNDDLSPMVLELPLGSRPCAIDPDQAPPEAGKLRVEGVEKDGARWIVYLAMAPDRRVRKGDKVGSATIDEVLFQSEHSTLIRRARVAVTGDASSLSFGDLVAAP